VRMHILDPAPLLDNFHHKQLEEVPRTSYQSVY
jgi:hypothetical protein